MASDVNIRTLIFEGFVRFGPDNRFRILYDIDEEARVAKILAVDEKQRERLFIGGEEVQL